MRLWIALAVSLLAAGDGGPGTLVAGPASVGRGLSQAGGGVFLHFDGVTMEPGSEAEVFIADPAVGLLPTSYVGSVGSVVGNPSRLPLHTLEVNDFEADSVRYTPRTTLRAASAIQVHLVVARGSVTVDRFVLTTSPTP